MTTKASQSRRTIFTFGNLDADSSDEESKVNKPILQKKLTIEERLQIKKDLIQPLSAAEIRK